MRELSGLTHHSNDSRIVSLGFMYTTGTLMITSEEGEKMEKEKERYNLNLVGYFFTVLSLASTLESVTKQTMTVLLERPCQYHPTQEKSIASNENSSSDTGFYFYLQWLINCEKLRSWSMFIQLKPVRTPDCLNG